MIKEKEVFLLKSSAKKGEWEKQYLRIIVDTSIVSLYSPIAKILPNLQKLWGAKIGTNSIVQGKLLNADLIEIGSNVVVGDDSIISAHIQERDSLVFKKVEIGNSVTIGGMAAISPGVKIGDNSIVAACSMVLKNSNIPPNEIWAGVPARRIRSLNKDPKKNR